MKEEELLVIEDTQVIISLVKKNENLETKKKSLEKKIAAIFKEINLNYDSSILADINSLAKHDKIIQQHFQAAKKGQPIYDPHQLYFRHVFENCFKTLNLLERSFPEQIIPLPQIFKLFSGAYRLNNPKQEQYLEDLNTVQNALKLHPHNYIEFLYMAPPEDRNLKNMLFHFYNKEINPELNQKKKLTSWTNYKRNPKITGFVDKYNSLKNAIIRTQQFIIHKFGSLETNGSFFNLLILEQDYITNFEKLFSIHKEQLLTLQQITENRLIQEKISVEFQNIPNDNFQESQKSINELIEIVENEKQLQQDIQLFLATQGDVLTTPKLHLQFRSLHFRYGQVCDDLNVWQTSHGESTCKKVINEIKDKLEHSLYQLKDGVYNKSKNLRNLENQLAEIETIFNDKKASENISVYLERISSGVDNARQLKKVLEYYEIKLAQTPRLDCINPHTKVNENILQYCLDIVQQSKNELQDVFNKFPKLVKILLGGQLALIDSLQKEVFEPINDDESTMFLQKIKSSLNGNHDKLCEIKSNEERFRAVIISFLELNKNDPLPRELCHELQVYIAKTKQAEAAYQNNIRALSELDSRINQRTILCNRLNRDLTSAFINKRIFFFTPKKANKRIKQERSQEFVKQIDDYQKSGECEGLLNYIKNEYVSFSDTKSRRIINRIVTGLLDSKRAVPSNYFSSVENPPVIAVRAQKLIEILPQESLYKNQLLAIYEKIEDMKRINVEGKQGIRSAKMITLCTHLKTDLDYFVLANPNNFPCKDQLEDFQFKIIARLRSQDDLLEAQPKAVLASIANFLIAVFTIGLLPLCYRYRIFTTKEQDAIDQIDQDIQNVVGMENELVLV